MKHPPMSLSPNTGRIVKKKSTGYAHAAAAAAVTAVQVVIAKKATSATKTNAVVVETNKPAMKSRRLSLPTQKKLAGMKTSTSPSSPGSLLRRRSISIPGRYRDDPEEEKKSTPTTTTSSSPKKHKKTTEAITSSNPKKHNVKVAQATKTTSKGVMELKVATATPKAKSQPTSYFYPLCGDRIEKDQVNDHDVFMGRGGMSNYNKGNLKFRSLIAEKRAEYKLAPKGAKKAMAEAVIQIVRLNGGRFLREQDGAFWEVPSEIAVGKASQALREDHPFIKTAEKVEAKKKIRAEKVTVAAAKSSSRPNHHQVTSNGNETRKCQDDQNVDIGSSHDWTLQAAQDSLPRRHTLTGSLHAPRKPALEFNHSLLQQQQPCLEHNVVTPRTSTLSLSSQSLVGRPNHAANNNVSASNDDKVVERTKGETHFTKANLPPQKRSARINRRVLQVSHHKAAMGSTSSDGSDTSDTESIQAYHEQLDQGDMGIIEQEVQESVARPEPAVVAQPYCAYLGASAGQETRERENEATKDGSNGSHDRNEPFVWNIYHKLPAKHYVWQVPRHPPVLPLKTKAKDEVLPWERPPQKDIEVQVSRNGTPAQSQLRPSQIFRGRPKDQGEWFAMYDQMVRFLLMNGECINDPKDIKEEDLQLHRWAMTQRQLYRENKLDLTRQRLLDQIGFVWLPTTTSSTLPKKRSTPADDIAVVADKRARHDDVSDDPSFDLSDTYLII